MYSYNWVSLYIFSSPNQDKFNFLLAFFYSYSILNIYISLLFSSLPRVLPIPSYNLRNFENFRISQHELTTQSHVKI